MEMAAARPQRGKGKRYPDRDYGKVKKALITTTQQQKSIMAMYNSY
jgi:hypothetical protein